jgi:hypothetical protein
LSFSAFGLVKQSHEKKWFSKENKFMKNEGCEIFMNKTKYEDEIMKKTKEISNLQTKRN